MFLDLILGPFASSKILGYKTAEWLNQWDFLLYLLRPTMTGGHKDSEFILEMKIPDYIFGVKAIRALDMQAPSCPVLVFINSKSGGQLGVQLLKSYRVLLSPKQVFDLSMEKPEKVLSAFFNKLEKHKVDGDKIAESIQRSLRIIVAGGDGTAGWLLGVIGDLNLPYPPPIAMVPLGTGNNLPYSFGWGKKNPGTNLEAAKNFLLEVYGAQLMNIDSWHIVMKMATTSQSLEPVRVPHSLHLCETVSQSDELHEASTRVFHGGFWNYFSLGMDAQVAYEFHKRRQEHPERFRNQVRNQAEYAMIAVTQGWFMTNALHPTYRNINQIGNIYVQRKNKQEWKQLNVSKRIRSIVMLNLPSFCGGFNPWGIPSSKKSSKRILTAAFVNDGLIEIVGFRDGWHGLALFTPKGHGTRLAQAHKVRIELHKGFASETYMRMDGEPWLQPLPDDESKTVIEITRVGQAAILTTSKCMAQCVPCEEGKMNTSSNRLCSPLSQIDGSELVHALGSESESTSSVEEIEVVQQICAR